MNWNLKPGYIHAAITLAILNVLDLITTWLVLSSNKGEELNPIADFLIGTYLLVPVKILVCGAIATGAVWAKPEQITPRIFAGAWTVTGIYLAVVTLNTVTYFTA